jgi:hypothetical protein
MWGVWCKGVQCSMTSELKHIRISSLDSLIVTSLQWNTKNFGNALVAHPLGLNFF